MYQHLNNLQNKENSTSSYENTEEIIMYNKANNRSPGSGSISKNRSGTFRAQVTLPSLPGTKPKRLTKSFRVRKDAETWIRKHLNEVDAGLTAENHNTSLGEFAVRWLETKGHRVRIRTFDDYQRYCNRYIIPALGSLILRTVRPSQINQYYSKLLENGSGAATVSYVHRVLRAIFSDAQQDGIINSNPCSDARPPRVRKSRNVEAMSRTEVTEFLRLAGQHYKPYVALFRVALGTGMRLGELLGLTWRAIDFSQGTISVFQQIPARHVKGEKRTTDRPKTDYGVRTLPTGKVLLHQLGEHRLFQQAQISMAGSRWQLLDFVFTSSVGTPLQPGLLQKSAKKIFRLMGLPDSFTFHNLRHTAASIMLNGNMSLVEVSRYLGHSSPAITAQIYAHLIPGGLEKARDIQDALIDIGE